MVLRRSLIALLLYCALGAGYDTSGYAPILVSNIPNQSSALGAQVVLNAYAYLKCGDYQGSPGQTWWIAGKPNGALFDLATGLLTGSPTSQSPAVQITCANATGQTSTNTFVWSVTGGQAGPVVATGFFLDCTNGGGANGSNSNNGTSFATPWGTVGQVNSAVTATSAKVWLKAGTTCTNQTLVVDWDGTAGDHVKVGSYYVSGGIAYQLIPDNPTAFPTAYTWSNGTIAKFKGTYNAACSRTLSGNTLPTTTCLVNTAGAFPTTQFAPIVTMNCSFCDLQSVRITEGAGRGLELGRVGSGQSVAAGYHDRTVRNVWVDQHATGSLQVFPGLHDFVVGSILEKCCVSQDKADVIVTGHASQIQVGTYDVGQNGVWTGMDLLIERNAIGPGWGEGIIASKVGHLILRGNAIGSTTDVPIYMAECTNCVIEYNRVWGGHLPNQGGGADTLPAENGFYGYMEPAFVQDNSNANDLLIRGNSFANTTNCIKLAQAPTTGNVVKTSARVYNNTCVNMTTGLNVRNDIAGRIGTNGIQLRNNIFYNENGTAACEATTPVAAGLDWDYNLWGVLPTASCRGANDPAAANPLLVGSGFNTKTSNTTPPTLAEFALQAGSPALGVGLSLSAATILNISEFPISGNMTYPCATFDAKGWSIDAVCRAADATPDLGGQGR